MRTAVTYDSGNVFQHFGKSSFFKIYDIEEGKIISSEVIETEGISHEALADLLKKKGVSTVICGGIGSGAVNALASAEIKVYAGAKGSADDAVADMLSGKLAEGGANCDHHHDHNENEEAGGCGGHCGSGCGGHCSGPRPVIMEGKNAGKTVRVHYKGTFNDGSQFDSSYDRGQPLEFVCGTGMMIHGFDAAVVNMEVGQSTDIHLMPEDAYGMADPNLILRLKISDLPGSENLIVGQQVYLRNSMGQSFPVHVTEKDTEIIVLDANHEMAGKELNFHIELLAVE